MGNKQKRKAAWKKWKKKNNVLKQAEKAELRNFLKTRAVWERTMNKAKEVADGHGQI